MASRFLWGTVSVGRDGPATALDKRLRGPKSLAHPVILRDVKVGVKTKSQIGGGGPHGVVAYGSRRTESLWVRTTVSGQSSESPIATMLLNIASIKESYSTYLDEYAKLYAAN